MKLEIKTGENIFYDVHEKTHKYYNVKWVSVESLMKWVTSKKLMRAKLELEKELKQ